MAPASPEGDQGQEDPEVQAPPPEGMPGVGRTTPRTDRRLEATRERRSRVADTDHRGVGQADQRPDRAPQDQAFDAVPASRPGQREGGEAKTGQARPGNPRDHDGGRRYR